MNFKYYSLVFVLTLISCGTNTSPKLSKVERNFNKIKTTTGQRDVSLRISNNRVWNMRMSFPKDVTQKKPLIIALHWAGGGDTYKEFSTCLIEPGMTDLDAYIIAPDGEHLLWTNQYNENKIIKIVAFAKKYWNVDPKRIIVTGYSNGGIGSWFFADKYPKLFTAAIPIAGVYYAENKINIPMYVIHGEKDELFKIQKIVSFVEIAKNNGSDIKLVVNTELSHHMACSYVHELKKATNWLKKKIQ
ncbi:MAG TPA: hypothetical protein EYG92_07240 [Lutibacter sp.]|nr:hypothetical protein [Lutibacter sp.]